MGRDEEPNHLREQRRDDARFLADQGETMEVAAKRLGISHDALDKWLDRHDKALRAKFMANLHRAGRVRGASVPRELGW